MPVDIVFDEFRKVPVEPLVPSFISNQLSIPYSPLKSSTSQWPYPCEQPYKNKDCACVCVCTCVQSKLVYHALKQGLRSGARLKAGRGWFSIP